MSAGKKSFKIFIFGVISQVVTLGIGIILPRLMIVGYGSEVNGLLSSIKQVFVYVSLLEAGIGTASLQALYAPIAHGDRNKTSEIMAATDRYFKRTGVLYGVAVIALAIFYPIIVHSDIAPLVVIAVILLQGMSGVIKYFFQGKFTILLRVDGKSYISTNVSTIVNVAAHIAQIVLILCGFNVIAVQLAYFVINLLQMIYITRYIKKHYEWLDLKAKPDYPALNQSKFVIVHQISGLIFNNTDMLILTYFCGLKTVSVYSIHNLIFGCVGTMVDTLCSSVEFILGQAFNSDRERFLRLQETYETYYLAVSFAVFTICLIMFPSFIAIYSYGIEDANYVDPWLPYLFLTINVLMYARRTSSQIINFSGHFKQTQFRSIIESAINLSVSLVLVNWIGMYGVLVGTIVALLYRTNDVILYANRKIMKRSPLKTYRRWIQNTILMVVFATVIPGFLPSIDNYLTWILNSMWVSIVCFVGYLLVDTIFDFRSFLYAKEMLIKIVKKA